MVIKIKNVTSKQTVNIKVSKVGIPGRDGKDFVPPDAKDGEVLIIDKSQPDGVGSVEIKQITDGGNF